MTILDLKRLVKDFGGLRAVDGLNLSVQEGKILGLIGPNGAGKSTVFNCIAGVYPPTEGEIYFDGTKINNVKPWNLCKQGLARTFQIVKPFSSKTVLYNVMVGSYVTTDKRSVAEDRALAVLPRRDDSTRLVPSSITVLGSLDFSSSITGRPVRKEMPKSKVRVDRTYRRNCTGRDWSRP